MAGSILDSLWSLVSPREAEAKIVGGPREMAMLEGVKRSNQWNQGQYLPDQYQRVMAAAQAHPALVRLVWSPGLLTPPTDDPEAMPVTAAYEPARNLIRYDPGLPKGDLPNTITHELVHFLNSQRGRPQGPAAQHALIKQFLGTDVYDPTTSLEGYLPSGPSAVEHNIWRKWLGGVPEAWEGGR